MIEGREGEEGSDLCEGREEEHVQISLETKQHFILTSR